MRRSWTRRRFLLTAVGGAAAVRAAGRALAAPAVPAVRRLSARTRSTLRAAMDEIVPAGDGMPSASESGVMRYLEELAAREPGIRRELQRAVAAIEQASRPARFGELPSARRVQVLTALETNQPAAFTTLRDFVYEGYYTRPEVWGRIGFEFYGPERAGPGLPPFDEVSVERVKALPAFYRKVTR